MKLQQRLLSFVRREELLAAFHQSRRLLGESLMRQTPERIRDLSCAEVQVYSQFGEDGIIDWLVRRLEDIPETFVEFGVESYREANTRLLLQMRNWSGLVMDSSGPNIEAITASAEYWRHDLTATEALITRDNVNDLIAAAGFTGEVGLLSVDIDGNDYWVLDAIDCIRPWIVVAEYNAVFGDLQPLAIPYRADFRRSPSQGSNLYFGASLPALEMWASRHGYTFVGTNSAGCNAFFVRTDKADPVRRCLDRITAVPSRFRESRDSSSHLSFVRGAKRLELIRGLPLIDVRTGQLASLSTVAEMYSSAWQLHLDPRHKSDRGEDQPSRR